MGDWLSSDRPPLQAGWILLFRPLLEILGDDGDTLGQAIGLSFELLWVPFLWLFVRRLGAGRRQADASVAAVAFTGFALFHSVYTWPKLGAAALMCGAFLLWLPESREGPWRWRFVSAGLCAGLGWMSHGGVAFSLVGLVPVAVALSWRGVVALRNWGESALGFLAIALPWACYQRFYEPPGDRLLKWHLAGVVDPADRRSFLGALVQSYREVGWGGALENRWSNLRMQFWGDWSRYLRFVPAPDMINRRWDETEYAARSFGWWIVAVPALIIFFAVLGRRAGRFEVAALVWCLGGWLAAVLMLFNGTQATLHQGTLVTQVVGFALLCWVAGSVSRWFFLLVAGLQIVSFFLVWSAAAAPAAGPVNPLCAAVGLSAAAVLAGRIAIYGFGRGKVRRRLPVAIGHGKPEV